MRNGGWDSLARASTALALTVFFAPAIAVVLTFKLLAFLIRLAVNIVLGVMFVSIGGLISLFSSRPFRLEIDWR